MRVFAHQGDVSSGWAVIKLVSHKGGLSFSGFSTGWSFIRMVSDQVSLSSGCFFIRMVAHQGGLSSGWSVIMVVAHQGGRSSWFPLCPLRRRVRETTRYRS